MAGFLPFIFGGRREVYKWVDVTKYKTVTKKK